MEMIPGTCVWKHPTLLFAPELPHRFIRPCLWCLWCSIFPWTFDLKSQPNLILLSKLPTVTWAHFNSERFTVNKRAAFYSKSSQYIAVLCFCDAWRVMVWNLKFIWYIHWFEWRKIVFVFFVIHLLFWWSLQEQKCFILLISWWHWDSVCVCVCVCVCVRTVMKHSRARKKTKTGSGM